VNMAYKTLFEPFNIGSMKVFNRIVMSALSCNMPGGGGQVSERDEAFYAARAKGGVGLIITGGMTFAAGGGELLPGLRRLAFAVHKFGSRICAQITVPALTEHRVYRGGDAMREAAGRAVSTLTKAQIAECIGRYGKAAALLKSAGFDAVEISLAFADLAGCFLSPLTNGRGDEYGGSFEGRMRFGREAFDAVRGSVGPEYPVIVRISADEYASGGYSAAEGIEIAKAFEGFGADAIDVTCGSLMALNAACTPMDYEEGWNAELPQAIKRAISVPVIGACAIRSPQYADALVSKGVMDFAASARAFLADPEWANKAQAGLENTIRYCISCLNCMRKITAGEACECAVNFQAGRESEYGDAALVRDNTHSHVAVIGAGPAGLEAALVLAKRGFAPVVFEKGKEAGGSLLDAGSLAGREKWLWLIDTQIAELNRKAVEIRYGEEAQLEAIQALEPAAVILACGAKAVLPDFANAGDTGGVYSPEDIFKGKAGGVKLAAVIGSGSRALMAALYLAQNKAIVSVFAEEGEIGAGLYFQNREDFVAQLEACGAQFYTGFRFKGYMGGVAAFEAGGEETQMGFDAVVLEGKLQADEAFASRLKEHFKTVICVGSAKNPDAGLAEAVGSGYLAGFEL